VIVRRFVWYAGLVFVAGCARPTIPGPQLTCIPEGFGFDGHFQTTQRFLPGRQILEQRGYVVNGQDPTANYILIMTLSKATEYESLLQNWNANLDRTGAAEWGPLQPMTMKNLPAWYWRVEWHDDDEQLIARDIVTVVSDESSDKTYVLDFHATTPKYMDETVMQNALASFRVKATSVSVAKLGAVIALAAGFAFVYTRARGTLA